MTASSALTALNTDIQNARTAITNKGGTVTSGGGSSQLATDIATIPSGTTPVITSLNVTPTTSAQTITAPSGTDGYSPINVSAVTASIDNNITAGNIKSGVSILDVTGTYSGTTPTGTLSITANGVYDVTNYASANVSVSGGGGYTELPNYQIINGVAQKRTLSLTGNEFSGITSIDSFGLFYAFFNCTGLTGAVVFPSLTTISGTSGMSYTFRGCTGLTSVDLSSLTTISGVNGLSDAFYDCSGIISVNLSALTLLSGDKSMQSAFYGCKALTNVYFNSLTTTSFGSYTNQFSGMMGGTGTDVIHTLHFPSNLETTIQGLSGYPLFSGTSGYVTLAFDLPATN